MFEPFVRVTERYDAPAERVFDAWLDGETAGKWLFATPAGRMVRVEIEGRAGGRFSIVDRRDGEDVEHMGEYVAIERPRRLVFTFGVPKYSPLMSEVEVEIVAAGSGCELTLTNQGIPPEYVEANRRGWAGILSKLAAVVGG